MKRRIFSFLLVLVMIFQIVPVMAQETTGNTTSNNTNEIINEPVNIDVYDTDSLFSLNNHLRNEGLVVNVTSDFTVYIDEDFISQHGFSYIGSEGNPLMGIIEGNNKTITLYVNTNTDKWALFHTLKNMLINNLNIAIYEFSSNSNSRNVAIAGLAQKTINTRFYGGIKFEPESLMYNETNNFKRNIDIGFVSLLHEGTGVFYLMDLCVDLYSIPSSTNVTAGIINSTAEMPENSNNELAVYITDNDGYINVYANSNNYIVGSAVANLLNAELSFYGDVSLRYLEGDVIGYNNTEVILGGAVGVNHSGSEIHSYNQSAGETELYLGTFANSRIFYAGGIVGENGGLLDYHYSSIFLKLGDVDGLVSFYDGYNSNNSNINIGGVTGITHGNAKVHSIGVNVRGLSRVDFGNSAVNFGLIYGLVEDGDDTIIENSGLSLISDEISKDENDSFGIFVGKNESSNDIKIAYNTVNLTDEHSFEKDYGWIPNAIGNVEIDEEIDSFKNNYFGYMGYAVLNQPTQIFFTKPMNYHGDLPVEETAADYPYLITYNYMFEDSEMNEHITFDNPSERGVGKVTVGINDIVSIKTKISVIDENAKEEWIPKIYLNYDILNILGEEDNDNEGGTDTPGNDNENDNDEDDDDELDGENQNHGDNNDNENDENNENDGDNEGGNNENNEDDENDNGATGENPEEDGDGNTDDEEDKPSKPSRPVVIRPRPSTPKEENKVAENYSYYYTLYKNNAEYQCLRTEYSDGTFTEQCEKVRNMNYDGSSEYWDSGFVDSGFSQAVVNKGEFAGMPLPTYNNEDKSDVLFNMHELEYEIKFTNNTFTDITESKYEQEIIEAANRLIIRGYGDGTFGPNKAITRAEFATMVVRTLGVIPGGTAKFNDVNEESWYYGFVNAASDLGIVVGVGNDLFAPEKNITRQEAAIMLMRAAKILEDNKFKAFKRGIESISFTGYAEAADWAKEEVLDSVLYNIIDLRENNEFEPLANITREETASALLNLLKNYKIINK